MTIRNKYIVNIVAFFLRKKVIKAVFHFERILYDKDLTRLTFLNRTLNAFEEQSDAYKKTLKEEIRKESGK